MKRAKFIGLCLVALLMMSAVGVSSASALPKALIDEATVTGGASSQEATTAGAQGFEVTVVSDTSWGKMTQAEFGQYQLLIAGDPTCGSLPPGLIESAPVYGPVVLGLAGGRTTAGNRILVGTDPVLHDGGITTARGTIIRDGIGFAGKRAGTTGMYFDSTCAANYHAQSPQTLEILAALSAGSGSWTIDAEPPCGGNVSLIASNSSFSDLTTEDLEGWSCSVHESFPTFTSDWSALAVATDTTSHPTCGVDPNTGKEACGEAYILVAGSSIIVKSGSIELTPLESTNPVGTDHTVTAHVSSSGSPLAGQTVTFTVTGQNAGATGTCVPASCMSDTSGNVSFTYHDSNGAGEDTIKASFTDESGSLQSATAQKHWSSATKEPTITSTSLSGGGKSGANITVPNATSVTDTATITGTNASTATGMVTYKVYSDSACTTEVVGAGEVTVTGGTVPSSNAETLKPGTYYWQASYGGDTSNEESKSVCGSEVETVLPPEECSTVIGSASVVIHKEGETERQTVTNKLSTNPATKPKQQKLIFTWEKGASKLVLTKLTSATCVANPMKKRFDGKGEATVNGESGWRVQFYFVLTKKNSFTFHIRAGKPKESPLAFTDRAANLSSEKIS